MFTETKEVVSKEVAVQEVLEFVHKNGHKKVTLEDIEENYSHILEKVMSGHLQLEGIPVLKLEEPIKNEDGEEIQNEVEFKHTRIKPSQMSGITKGLDLKKDPFGFITRCTSFLLWEPISMLDKLSKNDYKVVEEMTPVFM